MIADDIAAAKAAGAATPPPPTSNPLKLKKAAAELFAAEDVETTDISYLQVSIAKLLAIAVKTRKVPTKETETYTGKDGTEKTRKVTEDKKVIQLTLDYDEFFAAVTDAPADYRITNAEIPVGSIASRVVEAKKAKKATSPKASAATPAKAASAAAAPDAPKKAKKAASPKRAKAADAAKALVMPVLTEEQLETLLKVQPPLAEKAQVRTMKTHLIAMGVEEKDFKQARADWVAYRADHAPIAPAALLDDAKMEHLSALAIGPRPQVRNPKMVKAFEEWGIAEADYKKAAMEYKAWAKENGVESAKGSKTASPKVSPAAAPAAPPAIRSPTANPFEGSDDEEEEDETETPVSDAGEAHETALEAIGDAEDIGAWD
jgi:hypothetical protein